MTADLFKQKFGYEIEGVWFPRVTSITALCGGSSFFRKADPLGTKFGFQQAAIWGTMVHQMVEKILKNEEVEIDASVAVSIETFCEWKREYPFEVLNPKKHIERRVVNFEQGYAGTIDIIAKIDGVLSIVDLKTSTSFSREYGLQTAAYAHAFKESEGIQDDLQRWILRLDQYQECVGCLAKKRTKYGRPKIAGGNELCNHQWSEVKGEVEFKQLRNYEKDLYAFLELKERWEWQNQEWLSRIPNYEKNIKQYSLL